MGHRSDSDRKSRSGSKHRSSSKHGSVHGDSARKKSPRSSQYAYDEVEPVAGPSSVRKSRSRSSKHGFDDEEPVAGPSSVRKSRSRSRSRGRPSSRADYDEISLAEPSVTSSRRKSHRSSHNHHDDSASVTRPPSAHHRHSSSHHRHHHHLHDYDTSPPVYGRRALGPPLPHELGIPVPAGPPACRVEPMEREEMRNPYGTSYTWGGWSCGKWMKMIFCCGCGKCCLLVWVTLIIIAAVVGGVVAHQKNSGGCYVVHDPLFHEEEVHALIAVMKQDAIEEGQVGYGYNFKHGFIIPLPEGMDPVPVDGVRGTNNLNLTVMDVVKGFLKPAAEVPPENFFLRMGPGRLVGGILLISTMAPVLVKVFSMWKGRHQNYERIPERPHDEEPCSHWRGLEGEWHACEACSLIEGQR